ncbi:HEAT repeat domain-containing protein [Alienimonas californiensis]|uniref:HEAT repeat protein n=1 Tax=Alienimonas californiensis TaxID=2527989 RepID=A0A517P4Y0_9PLAN|nr:HEAT repeat domain-containing protein [Alienimonas californiensis]QDT14437.1 hypothetical protein CA12_05100 [Alienimonas californiensis]
MSRRAAAVRWVPLLCLPWLTGCFSQGYGIGFVAGKLVTGQPIGTPAEERAVAGGPAPFRPQFDPQRAPSRPEASRESSGPSVFRSGGSYSSSRPASEETPAYDQQMVDYNRRMAEQARERAEQARERAERLRGGGNSPRGVRPEPPIPGSLPSSPDGVGSTPFGFQTNDEPAGDAPAPMTAPPAGADSVAGAATAGRPLSLREPAEGESEPDWAVRVLETATESDWVARKKAVEYLEGVEPSTVTPEQREQIRTALSARLAEAVEERGFVVDRAAKTLLVWAETPEQFTAIGEALREGTGLGRKDVLSSLDPTTPNHARVAAPLLTHDWEGDEALAFVRTMGAPAEPAVLPLLDDPNPATRRDVASLLAEIGGEASAEALRERAAKESDRELARHLRVQRAAILDK